MASNPVRIAELQRELTANPASRQFYQLGELLRRDGRGEEAAEALRANPASGLHSCVFGTRERNPVAEERGLSRRPMDYYKMLYADTALNGEIAATRCGHDFFGTPFCLFATDAPFDAEEGRGLIRDTVAAVTALEISTSERERIFFGNASALLKLRNAANVESGAAP